MDIRHVEQRDRVEWQRMRVALYSNPAVEEIDEFFESHEPGGTRRVGVIVLVAERGDGRLAGFVEIGSRHYAEGCDSSPVAYLEGWYVDPDCRRNGLGRRLAEAAESWARDNGYTEMASDTELDNETSLRAHLAIGYDEVERQICFRKRLATSK